MPQIAQILVSTFKIFRGSIPPDTPPPPPSKNFVDIEAQPLIVFVANVQGFVSVVPGEVSV